MKTQEVDEDDDGAISFREFMLIFRKAAAGELREDSGLGMLAKECEINVEEVGVGGAKDFFEAKVKNLSFKAISNNNDFGFFRSLLSEKPANLKKRSKKNKNFANKRKKTRKGANSHSNNAPHCLEDKASRRAHDMRLLTYHHCYLLPELKKREKIHIDQFQ